MPGSLIACVIDGDNFTSHHLVVELQLDIIAFIEHRNGMQAFE